MKTMTIKGGHPLGRALAKSDEDVVLMRDGHAVALVVPFDDDDLQWYSREHDPAFIASIQRGRDQVAKRQTVSHDDLVHHLRQSGYQEIRDDLVTDASSVGAIEAEELAPHHPGIYAIFIDRPEAFPERFRSELTSCGTRLIYVGLAKKSLRRRLVNEDLRHRGPSTFFRSLGAVLGFKPIPGSLNGKKNKHNYVFSDRDTRAIAKWINRHLRVKWLMWDGALDELVKLESHLIRECCPIFNSAGNPQKSKGLKSVRDACRQTARE